MKPKAKAANQNLIDLEKRREERKDKPTIDFGRLHPDERYLFDLLRDFEKAAKALDKYFKEGHIRNPWDRLTHRERFYYNKLWKWLKGDEK